MKRPIFSILTITTLLTIISPHALAEAFHSIQLQAPTSIQVSLQQHLQLPQMHRETFGPGQDFIYLGKFDSESQAQTTLDQLVNSPDYNISEFQPLIVELFVADKIANKTQDTRAAQTAAPIEKPSSSQPRFETATTAVNRSIPSGPFYTVALAAFEDSTSLQRFVATFAERQPDTEASCRIKNNGLYAAYTGIYGTYNAAVADRDRANQHRGMSAYILKFNDFDMQDCEAL